VLGYLDTLCAALLVREAGEILRLLQDPLARELPRRVRAEALLIARAGPGGLRAPVHALHFYHQMAHLAGARTDSVRREPQGAPRGSEDAGEASQLELALPLEAARGWPSE